MKVNTGFENKKLPQHFAAAVIIREQKFIVLGFLCQKLCCVFVLIFSYRYVYSLKYRFRLHFHWSCIP